jgi:hypothetical protein
MNDVLRSKFGEGMLTWSKNTLCKYIAVLIIKASLYNCSIEETFDDFDDDFGIKQYQFRHLH